jgi:ParB family chromosome partitioning protein
LRLLDLPAKVQEWVSSGQLSMGHARALVTAADPQALAQQVIKNGLSVRETENLARAAKPGPAKAAKAEPAGAARADIAALERRLSDMLGLRVVIRHKAKGGAVTLHYSSLDQLDMLCQRLSGDRF